MNGMIFWKCKFFKSKFPRSCYILSEKFFKNREETISGYFSCNSFRINL